MIKIKFFNSITEAELAKNLLKEHGIKVILQKKGVEFPGSRGDSYGADLFIEEKNFNKAKEILDEI